MDYKNIAHWVHGLLGAAIGGGANAITLMVVEPTKFNLHDGWKSLAMATACSMIVSAALYLKTSPLPPETDSTPTAPKP